MHKDMRLNFKKIAWLILALLPQLVSAQDKLFNISLGGGLEVLSYTPEIGKPKPGGGVLLEWQFQHFLAQNFGYGVGLGLSYFTANYYINETIEKQITDETDAGVPYTLRTIFDNFNEKQRTFQLEVPIGLYARFNAGSPSHWPPNTSTRRVPSRRAPTSATTSTPTWATSRSTVSTSRTRTATTT